MVICIWSFAALACAAREKNKSIKTCELDQDLLVPLMLQII